MNDGISDQARVVDVFEEMAIFEAFDAVRICDRPYLVLAQNDDKSSRERHTDCDN